MTASMTNNKNSSDNHTTEKEIQKIYGRKFLSTDKIPTNLTAYMQKTRQWENIYQKQAENPQKIRYTELHTVHRSP